MSWVRQLKDLFSEKRACDLLIKGARVVDLLGGEVVERPVAIYRGKVVALEELRAEEVFEARGLYLAPGFVDCHLHVESTLLVPHQFARACLSRGTTAVFADPHEMANVFGEEGVRFMIEDSEGLPVDFFFLLPSCVPASPLESSGASLDLGALRCLKAHPRVVGLGEFMDVRGLLEGDEGALEKLALFEGEVIDGHAPFLRGKVLSHYRALGMASDHETTDLQEVREKLSKGFFIYLREGSSAKDLEALLPLVTPYNADRFGFATDDLSPTDLAEGHIDRVLRKAVALGLDPIVALKVASRSPFVHFRLSDRGAVAPGFKADLVLLEDLNSFRVRAVIKDGKWAFKDGQHLLPLRGAEPPQRSPFRVPPVEELREKLRVVVKGRRVRAVALREGQIVTEEGIFEVPAGVEVLEGRHLGLPKVAVVERHKGTGRVGVGFLEGLGLKEGALASTVSHDAHNLVVAGMSDEEMLLAVEALRPFGGGLAVVRGGEVLARLPLPVAGLLSDSPWEEVTRAMEGVERAARGLGERVIRHPFMYLSFVALSVIPTLRVTDRGLLHVPSGQFLPLTF